MVVTTLALVVDETTYVSPAPTEMVVPAEARAAAGSSTPAAVPPPARTERREKAGNSGLGKAERAVGEAALGRSINDSVVIYASIYKWPARVTHWEVKQRSARSRNGDELWVA
jgi:hypothetical protein